MPFKYLWISLEEFDFKTNSVHHYFHKCFLKDLEKKIIAFSYTYVSLRLNKWNFGFTLSIRYTGNKQQDQAARNLVYLLVI